MMRNKKLPLLLLLIFILSCLFTSCSGKPADQDSLRKEQTNSNLHMAKQIKIILPGEVSTDQEEVLKEIEKLTINKLNTTLNIQYISGQDYITKIYMMEASAQKFDLFLCFAGELQKMIARNQIKPLNELLDKYGSDLKRVIPQDEFDALTVENKIFGVPSVYPRTEIAAHAIRKDLRIKYGLPEIDDIETFEKYLDAVKKNDGMIPYATNLGKIGGGMSRAFMGDQIDWFWGDDITPYVVVDWSKKPYKVENFFTNKVTLDLLKWNRKAYKNGWFPKDILTMQDSKSLFVRGKAAVVPADLYNLQELSSKLRKNIPEGEVELITFNKNKTHVKIGPSNNFACISSTSEYPEEAMKFLNWVRKSQDNYDLFMYGIKGRDYEIVDNKVQRLSAKSGTENLLYEPTSWLTRDFYYERFLMDDPDEYINSLKYWSNLEYLVCPINDFTISNANFRSEQAQIITLVREQWLPIFVGLNNTDEDYKDFLSNLERAGSTRMISDIQRQLDEYLLNKGQ